MVGVFINYRGEDSQTAAALIDRELTARFGSDNVFLDSRSIPAGTDFVEELLGQLRTCSVMLVVIGPHWLADAAGNRRINDQQDWIRQEIVAAFRLGLRVIPVLIDGGALPAEVELPADIAALSRRQYVPLRRRYARVDLNYLVERIIETDPELATAAPKSYASTGRSSMMLRVGIFGVLAIAVAVVGVLTVIWLTGHATTATENTSSTSASPTAPALKTGSVSDEPVPGLRVIPRSEDGYEACPVPNGDDWHLIELGDHPTGEVKTKYGGFIFTVKHAHWRELEPGKWQVSLDTVMENNTTKNHQHGSWNYNYFSLGKRHFELDAGGCFSADPTFVESGLQGDARAGFVVTCRPAGAMELVMQSDDDERVGEDARITITPAVEPSLC